MDRLQRQAQRRAAKRRLRKRESVRAAPSGREA
jgi:hypothetical protein